MTEKYFGRWGDYKDMLSSFVESYEGEKLTGDLIPTEDEVLFASYGGGAYEGDAIVIFEKEGKLYEVSGSHCSCNGLENQWGPSEISWPALKLRADGHRADEAYTGDWRNRPKGAWPILSDHENEAVQAFLALIDSRTA